MSHYKPYPAYKDPGVEWLGRVPDHWDVKPFKRVLRLTTARAGSSEWQVALENIEGWTGRFIETESAFSGEGVSFQRGDILFGKLRPYLAKAYVAPRSGKAVGDFFVLRPVSVDESEFLHRFILTPAVIDQINSATEGTKMPRASWDNMGLLSVAIPSANEQRQIVQSLDSETARIDALIEKKTRFIELLREKRQALITHAVTKGLDPNVKMKDSSVEWLGGVPVHWGIKPLKLLVKEGSTISYGIVQPGEPLVEGVPFVQTTNMSSGDFVIENLQKTTPEIAAGFPRSRLTGGEVILGIRASIGAAFVVPMHLAGVNLSRGVARIDCSSELSSAFLVAYLRSLAVDSYWQLAKQGSTFNEVSIATVKELLVPVPPRKEQEDIEGMISKATARLELLLIKTEHSIDLLKERRSALITAAVTGQIDLREAV